MGGADADADVGREALVGAEVVVERWPSSTWLLKSKSVAEGAVAVHVGLAAPFVGDVAAEAAAEVVADAAADRPGVVDREGAEGGDGAAQLAGIHPGIAGSRRAHTSSRLHGR